MRSPLLDRASSRKAKVVDAHALSAGENAMIRVKSLYMLATSIAGVFTNLYLYDLGGFAAMSWYYVGTFVFITVGFVAAGKFLGRYSLGTCMAVGAVSLAAVYAALPFIGTPGAVTLLAIGAAAGLGEAFYWSGNNVAEYVVADPKHRPVYLGRAAFWGSIASTVGPPLGGAVFAIADVLGSKEVGYALLFALMVASLCIVAASAVRASDHRGMRFAVADSARGLDNPAWRNVLAQQFFRGLWISALPALATALILVAVKTEFAVSVVAAVSTVFCAFASRYAGKVLQRREHAFLLGALLVPFGLIGFATTNGWLGLLCMIVIVKGFDPFASISVNKDFFAVMQRTGELWQESFHRQVQVEITLNAGRVLSFLAVIAVVGGGIGEGTEQVRQAIVLVAVAPLLVGILQQRLATSLQSA